MAQENLGYIIPHIVDGRWKLGTQDYGPAVGDNGLTPTIGGNGNWYIGAADTGVHAQGPQGNDGTAPHIDASTGNWFIGEFNTGVHAQGPQGNKGDAGNTPWIDTTTGNWFIGTTDTGVKAQGPQGYDGDTGTSPHVDPVSGNWFVGDVDTGIHAKGDDGAQGPAGTSSIPDWVSGTGYTFDNTVSVDNILYKCAVPNADVTFDSEKWIMLGGSDSGITGISINGGTPHTPDSQHLVDLPITSETVGLGNVENYAPEDMPISTVVAERFEQATGELTALTEGLEAVTEEVATKQAQLPSQTGDDSEKALIADGSGGFYFGEAGKVDKAEFDGALIHPVNKTLGLERIQEYIDDAAAELEETIEKQIYRITRAEWIALEPAAQLALVNTYESVFIDDMLEGSESVVTQDPGNTSAEKVFSAAVTAEKFSDVATEIQGLRAGNRYTNNFGRILDPNNAADQTALTAFAQTKVTPVPDGFSVLNTFTDGNTFQWYQNDGKWYIMSQNIGVATTTTIGAVLSSTANLHISFDPTVGDGQVNLTNAQETALNSGITTELTAAIPGKYVKPPTGIPAGDLATAYQPSIQTTGTSNVLLAPATAGGNPTGKALSELMASPAAQSTNQVLLAPSTKGAAPTLKALSDFAMVPALPEFAYLSTQYDVVTLATLNGLATRAVFSNFNGSGMTYAPWMAVKRSATQWDWMGTMNGQADCGTITSAGMTRTTIRKIKVTGTGANFALQRGGPTVFMQCSGRTTTAALDAWATIVSIPSGYRPSIETPDEDSIWVKGSVNGVMADFQVFADGRFRCSGAIASGSAIILGCTWITDNGFPA
jgi:hypothetical protein